MVNAKLNYFLIIFIVGVILINVYLKFFRNNEREEVPESTSTTVAATSSPTTIKSTEIISACTFNWDCEWRSTNCCTENAGAYWQCINKESYIDCSNGQTLCPQVVSPKPISSCVCENGSCTTK